MPPPKPTEITLQVNHRKLTDLDIDALEQDIKTYFEENSPYQEGVISETYQRPDKSYFQETTRIARSSEYRQTSAKVFTKTG